LTGWVFGIAVAGLILRYGLGAESFAWVAIFALSPVAAVFYPVSVLPGWLQAIAYALPPAHVFEGMRAVMVDHAFRLHLFVNALALNGLYMAFAWAAFFAAFARARVLGKLLQVGE